MKFFDLQVNGAFGLDFSSLDMTERDFLECVDKILATGMTRFLPTLPTASMEIYRRNLKLMNDAIDKHGLRYALPGFHLEGPFISRLPGAVGAHNPDWVQEPSSKVLDELNELAAGHITILTVAAELPGMPEFIKYAHTKGICVSLGHELPTEDQIDQAGADTMTHLGNGIPSMLDRHHNAIWAGLANDSMTIMGICDGHHLPVRVLKCYLRCKGLDRFVAVSDACNVAGMPPGIYHSYSNVAVLEPNGLYHNPEKGCLVGSSMLLPACAAFLKESGLVTEDKDLEKICWENPHKLVHLNP